MAPPVNDNYANRITLAAGGGSRLNDTNIDSTFEVGEPVLIATNEQSVWYEITPGTTGLYFFDISGLTPAALGGTVVCSLGVYDDDPFTTGVLIAQNASFFNTSDFRVGTSLSSATTYYIKVEGGYIPSGTNWFVSPTFDLTWTFDHALSPPANDDLANRTTINPTGETLTGETCIDASNQQGSGEYAQFNSRDQTVWYEFTPSSTGYWAFRFSNLSDGIFGTRCASALYTGTGFGDFVYVGFADSNNAPTPFAFAFRSHLISSTTYYLQVVGFQNAYLNDYVSPTFDLEVAVTPVSPPANDDIA